MRVSYGYHKNILSCKAGGSQEMGQAFDGQERRLSIQPAGLVA